MYRISAFVAIASGCNGKPAPPIAHSVAATPTPIISACPLAMESWPFWTHEMFSGCPAEPFQEVNLRLQDPVATPCRVTEYDGRHTRSKHLGYDGSGRWVSSRDGQYTNTCAYKDSHLARCNDLEMHYDMRGRLQEIVNTSRPDPPLLRAEYKGEHVRRLEMAEVPLSSELEYDADGRLITERMIAPAGSLELTYSYDAQGRVLRRSAQPSSPIRIGATYEYDPRTGLLAKRVEDWNSSGAVTSTFVYDAKRRPTRITMVSEIDSEHPGAGQKREFEYDYGCSDPAPSD